MKQLQAVQAKILTLIGGAVIVMTGSVYGSRKSNKKKH